VNGKAKLIFRFILRRTGRLSAGMPDGCHHHRKREAAEFSLPEGHPAAAHSSAACRSEESDRAGVTGLRMPRTSPGPSRACSPPRPQEHPRAGTPGRPGCFRHRVRTGSVALPA
jgi:hypothetical protein